MGQCDGSSHPEPTPRRRDAPQDLALPESPLPDPVPPYIALLCNALWSTALLCKVPLNVAVRYSHQADSTLPVQPQVTDGPHDLEAQAIHQQTDLVAERQLFLHFQDRDPFQIHVGQ